MSDLLNRARGIYWRESALIEILLEREEGGRKREGL
jgi:hypothetical protein